MVHIAKVALLFSVPLLGLAQAEAAPMPTCVGLNCAQDGGGGYTDSEGVGYRWVESEQAYYKAPRGGYEDGVSADGAAVQRWQLKYVATCEANTGDPTIDVLCSQSMCQDVAGPGVRMWVYRKPEGAPDSDYVQAADAICMGASSVVTLDQIQAAVQAQIEQFYERLGKPRITLEPQGSALVNLPVIASAPVYERQEFEIDNPLPGRVSAEPSYAWTWSNGETGAGPGRPYSPAVSPLDDPAYYPVSAVYGSGGTGRVSLDLEWAATVHVADNPPQTLDPVAFSTTEGFTIRQARTELVAD